MSISSQLPPPAPEVCPVCNEDVPKGSLACPECGADHDSGWKEDALLYDGLDLPDDEFNYDRFVANEFGSDSLKPEGISTLWWITGIVLVIALSFLYLLLR